MDGCRAILAQAKFGKAMQPRRCSLDYPAIDSKPTAVLTSAVTTLWIDAALSHFLPVRLRVLSAIGVQRLESLAWVSDFTTHV
jgi:hypothetical protein